MPKNILLIIIAIPMVFLAGCVTMPCEELIPAIEAQELADHVNFLAQPALKGRKPKTWQSQFAQEYIKTRFDMYGLIPWARTDTYDQPFLVGTNIIGVLPGADPDLRDEIVILTAHYDHIGTGKDGVYHGAADNASGVALLIEAAEHFSLSQNRPKRSICFASFDTEEMLALGAFVFTCRDDFDNSKIAAVVNVDVLGRDFIDIVENSLFVVGTEKYPQLRQNILKNAQTQGLKVLPLSSDLVGPRSDHIAFESLDIPVLFFTSGLYKDYHKTTDTPEKINFDTMTRSSDLILKTVDLLVNSNSIESPSEQNTSGTDSLRSLKFLIETIVSEFKVAGLTTEEVEKFKELARQTQTMIDSRNYTTLQYEAFLHKAIKMLMPVMAIADEGIAVNGDYFMDLSEQYSANSKILLRWYSEIVQRVADRKLGIFEPLDFDCKEYNLKDSDFSLQKNEIGEYDLDIIIPQVNFKLKAGWPFWKLSEFALYEEWSIMHFTGTRDVMIDHCLSQWYMKKTDASYGTAWSKVLNKVTGNDIGTKYRDWIQWRIKTLGCDDEEDWLQYIGKGDKDKKALGRIADDFYQTLSDPNQPTQKRLAVIHNLQPANNCEVFLALVELIDEQTFVHDKDGRITPAGYLQDSYPLADHRLIRKMKELPFEQTDRLWLDKTLGDVAQDKLIQLTKQDFGSNKDKWIKWIMQNIN